VPSTKAELIWLATGLSSLILGTLVYITDRNPDTVYFLSENLSLFQTRSGTFGPFGDHLPTFLHCFALILMTAAVLGSQRISAIKVSLAWMFIDSTFEIAQAQAISKLITTYIPSWFGSTPILENTQAYLIYGKFDVIDLISIMVGGIAACVLIQLTKRINLNESFKTVTN